MAPEKEAPLSEYTTRQILDMIEANRGPEGLDLSRKDLSGIDLSREAIKAELRKALKSAPGATPVWYSESTGGINLEGARLSEADLGEADLTRANLFRADLWAVNLIDAKLIQANLIEANLGEAYLWEANLHGANLCRAHLARADLTEADLAETNLAKAGLRGADLTEANLAETNLARADLSGADLIGAELSEADLREANLTAANLTRASLRGTDLCGVNLVLAQLVRTNLNGANLTGCRVFGISAWQLELSGATQTNLIITPRDEPTTITVDNLEVAQFIYLLLNNEKIRDVIYTITTKVVLILGRFTDERKVILEAIRDELRKYDYLPVLFTFDKPTTRDFIETVSVLAHLARFVIADVTDPKIVLEEIPHIVRHVAVPVQPILEGPGDAPMILSHLREDEPVTLYNLRRNHRSLLDTHWYKNLDDLLASLKEKIIAPAEAKAKELEKK
jgi:uncharacterized protein YjbI with pentapeptide repeats